jgi:bifunctional non-homologous end joining protein LigD
MPITTVDFPKPFEPERRGEHWFIERDGIEVKLSNLPKVLWPQRGYTKGDLIACYDNLSGWLLPYLHDRPLTLRRMPDGIEGGEFYEKQAAAHTPDWMPRAYIEGHGSRGHIDFLMAQNTASLLYVANLGCIEMHPMHARQQSFDRPDYLFFDLDPFEPITFATIRRVALVIHEALEQLGLTNVPKISGATGIVIYVPLNGEHTYAEARALVERICRLVHRAFPDATTMAPRIADRAGKVYLDHAMVSEGRNIASVYSMRPTVEATIGMPVTWEEMRDTDVQPQDFTIRSVWDRFNTVGDLFSPMKVMGTLQGHSIDAALDALGIDRAALIASDDPDAAKPRSLSTYQSKRDFGKTSEPAGEVAPSAGKSFLINKHHARRLHYDLRLERGGVLVSWAVPKGLPREANIRHLAVQTEDHPLSYAEFEGSIPEGEYGAGESRIYDKGRYEALEWVDGKKLTIRLHGARVEGEYHLVRTNEKEWMIFRSAKDAPAIDPPSPPKIEVMLASDGGKPFDDPAWMFEVKWDGVRTLATIDQGELKLVSRRGRDVTAIYPELAIMSEQLNGLNALIDGEIVVLGADGTPSFERMQRRFTSTRPSKSDIERDPVDFLAFDILWLDGESLLERPVEERRQILERTLVPAKRVQISQRFEGTTGTKLFEAVSQRGLEGLIAKRLGSTYRPGTRSKDWLKIKIRRELDAVIVGWNPSQGSKEGGVGSLLVAVHPTPGEPLRYAGHVGTGYTAARSRELIQLLEPLATSSAAADIPTDVDTATVRWVRPELVAAVEYLEMTSQNRMRAASYKGLRQDKDPVECFAPDVSR